MKQAMTIIAAVLVHAFAFGDISPYVSGTVLTVPEGEIVTATADDATAVAALTEVVFADATGVFEMTGAATFSLSAGVSGAGTVKVTSATSLTLSGDCRGFTGGWESSETPIVVTSRHGLGDAGTVGHSSSSNFGCYIRHTALATPITFSGDGLTNDVSVYIYGNGKAINLNVDEAGTWVQNGAFKLYKNGNVNLASVTFNGTFDNLSQTFYYVKAGSTVSFNAKFTQNGGQWYYRSGSGAKPEIHFNAPTSTSAGGEVNFADSVIVYFGAKDVFPAGGARLCCEQNSYVDLQGFDQEVEMMARKQKLDSQSKGPTDTVTSSVPAKVTIKGGSTTRNYASGIRFRGKVSLKHDSPVEYYLINGISKTEGSLEVANGIFHIDWDAQWSGTNVTVSGGTLILTSPNSLKEDENSLVVTGGKLRIDTGVTAFVSKAEINGVAIGDGIYTMAGLVDKYHAVDGFVEGDGQLAVGQNKPVVETVYDTWTGAAEPDTLLTTDGNWEDGTAPEFSDGSADLTFTKGTSLATASGDQSAVGLHFNLEESFTLAAESGAKIALGHGGLSLTNVSADTATVVTNAIYADLVNSVMTPGNVTCGVRTVLELKGGYTGGSGAAPITIDGLGEIVLEGENSDLASPLTLQVTDPTSATARNQPFIVRVRSATALGSPNRLTTIIAPGIRFECLTNETPISVKGYGMYNATYDGSTYMKRFIEDGRTLVFNGLVSSYGNISGTWIAEGITFRGGIKNNGGGFTLYVGPGRETKIMCGVDTTLATKQYNLNLQGGGDFRMGPAEHHYFRIKLQEDSRIVCEGEGALATGYPVLFATSTTPSGILDLNGRNQEVTYLSHEIRGENQSTMYGFVTSGEAYGVVTSSVPAVLTLNGVVTNDQCDKFDFYSSYPTNCAVMFRGEAGLWITGGEQWLSFVKNDSKGVLRVSGGTLYFNRGAGWCRGREVVVDGTGVLKTDSASADCLFGSAAGCSRVDLRIDGDGKLEVPAGSCVTVRSLTLGDSSARCLAPGMYGGEGAGCDAAHTLPCIIGGGKVMVRSFKSPGILLLVK